LYLGTFHILRRTASIQPTKFKEILSSIFILKVELATRGERSRTSREIIIITTHHHLNE